MNEHTPDFDSEDELQAWLESQFEDAGWTAIREVSPRNSSCRADLIVQHDDYGWIGIETKLFSTKDSGARIARGFEQIVEKYRGEKYLGRRIDLWVLAPYFSYPDESHSTPSNFIREFLCYFGVGYLDFEHWAIMLDFGYSNTDTKIFVKDITPSDHSTMENPEQRYGEIDEVRAMVAEKIERGEGL